MRCKMALAAVLVFAAGVGAAQGRTSIWDGVYTDAQAERGRTLYMQNCSRCHGVNLWGTYEVPPLVGRIMPYYSGTTLDVLFDYISTAMPLDHPGALGPSANTDIVAFILKSNNVPSGAKELSAGSLKGINFDSAGPASGRARK